MSQISVGYKRLLKEAIDKYRKNSLTITEANEANRYSCNICGKRITGKIASVKKKKSRNINGKLIETILTSNFDLECLSRLSGEELLSN
ncbi:hypothetical protein COV15_00390 [Candidatus Woesearchaeota archaeon CG10_big_fil_rev_8_21_14_0_10_34_12]|nr:MAG: hypothetical protein COV15_00390 [Candidatus Woesearchaeota archaeon CG10_big_fil_rev_8_21_14_0_10_34_12]